MMAQHKLWQTRLCRLSFAVNLSNATKIRLYQELQQLKTLMRESLVELRRFMFNLRPSSLNEQGLSITLEQYATDFANMTGIKVELDIPELGHLLSSEQEMAAFRVVQQALQNVAKHAAASRIQIYATRMPDGSLHIGVKDDGRGFETRKLAPTMGHGAGIPGMRERAEVVGGSSP